ncbi:hypothetical protein [Piscirickettsia salmonis]|uniref:hypothetical protein n=1 Tax=Piscirickettsia salmonis TaxID=1238 RepID=UPI00036B081B|nr:hypothetical protein [Piscirickettsia salmonis]AKP73251.2 hypothetical protein PSLF89_1293 [Piscirickettsia salmonis LF-89 = ATCC VR-1361]ALY02104.1 hypothetical protein AWE47_03850 [Piscirickettsia salmonis]AMA41618.1 hypothetical protein AWJ11_03845 [Piscirickettsia salmonis]AOS34101.1 hypothetical protein AVM72_01080 [Piscirickettsia salmonis]APS61508.1 hypothetical protein AVI53_13780 [Piscirickettsia salmonis]
MPLNYTLLLYDHSISIATARGDYPDPQDIAQWQEKDFLQSLNEHKEIRKLYAGWFLNQVESACGAITPKVESLFKKEMELAADDDLSKEKAIAKKVDQFRAHITQLEALAVNQTDAIKVALNNYNLAAVKFFILSQLNQIDTPSFEEELKQAKRKRRYLGRYFAHPMMQNRRAKRDDYKPSAVRVTQRYVP